MKKKTKTRKPRTLKFTPNQQSLQCNWCLGQMPSEEIAIRLSFPLQTQGLMVKKYRVDRQFCSWSCVQNYFMCKNEVPSMPVFQLKSKKDWMLFDDIFNPAPIFKEVKKEVIEHQEQAVKMHPSTEKVFMEWAGLPTAEAMVNVKEPSDPK